MRTRWIALALAGVALILGPGTAVAADEPVDAAPAEGYAILPGDSLEIAVWRESELTRTVLVRPDGGFSFPLVGEVEARGKTAAAIREELTERLQPFIPDLVVTVSVVQISGHKVYVIGQVARPGAFVVNPRVDVMQVLSMAGGMTAFAAVNDIIILRREDGVQKTFPFRYNDIAKGRALEQNIMLAPGDVVVVP